MGCEGTFDRGESFMPLPMKTLSETSMELGIPEAEIRTMVDLKKIRAVFKRGKLMFSPDEVSKIKRLRKTIPESAKPNMPAPVAAQTVVPPRRSPPPRR
jgi:hypothetical protein